MTTDPRRYARRLASLALAAALAACGDARAGGGWTGTVDTLANGAVLVSNPATGTWDPGEEWTIEEELRIGSADVEGPELFGQVASLAVDDLGRIYVAEGQAHEIRVFNPDGSHLRTLGRKGGGPGEFEQISGMDWGPDGNLWIMDTGNSRLSVFDTTGAYVTSHRREGGFIMVPWRGGFDRQGRLYDVTGVRDGTEFRQVLVRYDENVQPTDTFRIPEYENETFDLVDDRGLRRMSTWVPFTPNQGWTLDPEGDLWIGVNDRYRINHVTFGGDTTRVVERPFTPAPITDQEREEAMERLDGFVQQGGDVDASRIPDTKPAYGAFTTDDAGNLWVIATGESDAPQVWDVFDPEGRYLGAVTTDLRFGLYPRPVFRDGFLYAVTTDELEVPYVVRARIGRRG